MEHRRRRIGRRTHPGRDSLGVTSDRNERIYERRWSASSRVVRLRPHLWRTLAPTLDGKQLLEIGPGLRPTIPVEGSFFVDISPHAVGVLASRGGHAVRYAGGRLPFHDRSFDAVFAFEVLEHVREDAALFAEIRRVVRDRGLFVLSVPLRMDRWTALDDLSAHVRRYEPDELFGLLHEHRFVPEALEIRREKLNPVAVALKSALGERFPRLSDAVLQHVLFPLLVAYQRRSATAHWASPGTPIPAAATGVTVVARAAERTKVGRQAGDEMIPRSRGGADGPRARDEGAGG